MHESPYYQAQVRLIEVSLTIVSNSCRLYSYPHLKSLNVLHTKLLIVLSILVRTLPGEAVLTPPKLDIVMLAPEPTFLVC